MIHYNQLGYPTGEPKRAVIVPPSKSFCVIDADTGKIVLEKDCEAPCYSPSAEETVAAADFSELSAGRYILACKEERSGVFSVTEQPYAELRDALLQSFTMQCCGKALDCKPWDHKACHTQPAMVYGTTQLKDVSGGWHDAGDYGRYAVPAAMTAADLLWSYLFSEQKNEALLHTVRYELDWLLKMCDSEGGVFHKVSCAEFCGMIQPDEEREPLIICPVSSTATGGVAAVFALASRVYRNTDKAYADRLLAGARLSYGWLKANPNPPMFQNPPEIKTGEYGDNSDRDERYWAACELYAATGEETYWTDARSIGIHIGFGWANVGYFGSLAALFAGNTPPKDQWDEFRLRIQDSILRGADAVMEEYAKEPYGISLGRAFPWGSNMDAANNALLLLAAHRLQPSAGRRAAALCHLHYILGHNAPGYCYVSGFGHRSPEHIHHRPSEAAGVVMPAWLAGGPSHGLQDDYAKEVLSSQPPQKRYVDDVRSYSTNEITIYWNSALYALLSWLDDN